MDLGTEAHQYSRAPSYKVPRLLVFPVSLTFIEWGWPPEIYLFQSAFKVPSNSAAMEPNQGQSVFLTTYNLLAFGLRDPRFFGFHHFLCCVLDMHLNPSHRKHVFEPIYWGHDIFQIFHFHCQWQHYCLWPQCHCSLIPWILLTGSGDNQTLFTSLTQTTQEMTNHNDMQQHKTSICSFIISRPVTY